MRFALVEALPFSAERVFAAARDDLPRIAPYLGDVDRVEVCSDAVEDGARVQVHRWTGAARALPMLLRPFVRPEMLRWEQTTRWGALVAEWTVRVPALGAAVSARGVSRYVAKDAASCAVDIEGDVDFHPAQGTPLAGVPASASPAVERAVVGLVVPLIGRTTAAVGRYLDDRR